MHARQALIRGRIHGPRTWSTRRKINHDSMLRPQSIICMHIRGNTAMVQWHVNNHSPIVHVYESVCACCQRIRKHPSVLFCTQFPLRMDGCHRYEERTDPKGYTLSSSPRLAVTHKSDGTSDTFLCLFFNHASPRGFSPKKNDKRRIYVYTFP